MSKRKVKFGILNLCVQEKKAFVNPLQRTLYCVLFREIRLFTRSLKPNTWLGRVTDWFRQSVDHIGGNFDITETVHAVRNLYVIVKEGLRHPGKNRGTLVFSYSIGNDISTVGLDVQRDGPFLTSFDRKIAFVNGLHNGVLPKALHLLVAVCGLLLPEDFSKLENYLWSHCLDGHDIDIVQPVRNLLQCDLIFNVL